MMEWTLEGGGGGGRRREREDKLKEEGAVNKSEKVEKEYASRVVRGHVHMTSAQRGGGGVEELANFAD